MDVLLVEAQAFSDASEWDLAQLKHKAAISMLSKLEKAFVDLTSGCATSGCLMALSDRIITQSASKRRPCQSGSR